MEEVKKNKVRVIHKGKRETKQEKHECKKKTKETEKQKDKKNSFVISAFIYFSLSKKRLFS